MIDFIDNNVARVIVVTTKNAVETIIRTDNLKISEVKMKPILESQNTEMILSIFAETVFFIMYDGIKASGMKYTIPIIELAMNPEITMANSWLKPNSEIVIDVR